MTESKIQEKLRLLRASREAISKLIIQKMGYISFKELDYYNDLLERTVMAIDFLEKLAELEMKYMEAIVNSMTPEERRHPEILKNSRKVRIAKGCGKTNADINRVLKKFEQTKEMMKQMKQYQKSGRIPPGGLGGLGGF